MADLSRSAVLGFMDYLGNKGLMNRTTAAARKAAVNNVLGILDDDEAADVSKIDLDTVMGRFTNLKASGYTPRSLSTYKARAKAAIDDFLRYQKDPLNFKPGVQNAPRRSERPSTAQTADAVRSELPVKATVEAPPAAVSILPIPLRPDLTVKIQGLPFDLTPSEANKIAAVVKALAIVD